jgi:hypothetical protein
MKTFLSTKNKNSFLFYSGMLLISILLIYGDIFFLGRNLMYSSPTMDMTLGYFNTEFTFRQLHAGIFPLWCPNLMGGYPYFATFQTQILYPFAWVWYFFRITTATNIYFIFHLFLLGLGFLCWIWAKTKHPLSAFLGAMLITFGAYAPSLIYYGHTIPLASVVWAPWILFCIDNYLNNRRTLLWFLLTILVLSLQLAGGFPQHYFYTFLCVMIYALGILITNPVIQTKRKIVLGSGILLAYFYSILLLALQLAVSYDAVSATTRKHALPIGYLGLYSFSPYSFITAIVPFFFGDNTTLHFWGPWTFPTSPCYYGIVALTFVLIYLFSLPSKYKGLYVGITFFFLVISLGFYLPTFALITKLPLFNTFRFSSRAIFYAQIFVIAMASLGLDHLLLVKINLQVFRSVFIFLLSTIIGLIIIGLIALSIIYKINVPFWEHIIITLGYPFHSRWLTLHPNFPIIAAQFSIFEISRALVFCLICLILYLLSFRRRIALLYMVVFSICEVLLFSINIRVGFPVEITYKKQLRKFIEEHPGDQRFLKIPVNNWAQSLPPKLSSGDINGFESFRLQRYDEFINYTLQRNLDTVPDLLSSTRYHPLYRLLRCSYVFIDKRNKKGKMYSKIFVKPGALPHLLLINQWKIIPQRNDVLKAISRSNFDPMHIVALETNPHFYRAIAPTQYPSPKVTLLGSSSNWLDIKATTSKKAILLVTDAYAKGWKVFPYKDSSQQKYDVMPADFIVRGIPLSPGTHHFRLQYAPDAFYRGRNISLGALGFYILAWCGILGIELKRKCNNNG